MDEDVVQHHVVFVRVFAFGLMGHGDHRTDSVQFASLDRKLF
jgi:hypothetical protein